MNREEREQAIEVLQAKIDSIEDDQAYSQLSKSMYEDGYRRIDACKAAIAALRGPQPDPITGLKGCWHCRNIEAHHIEYVIAVKAKGGTPMNTPVDCPYHYCPACGRKLEVEE